jgi:plasmid stability protein
MHTKMIQIRHVPEALHKKLKARAAMAGMPLSDYLLREIRRIAEQPTIEELWASIQRRPPVEMSVSAADLIREKRERR